MSGIEIAGLVLGAFPLVIHALESYREGAETMKDWLQVQQAYKKCKHLVGCHRVVFENTLEELLLPLVENEDELKELMDDPAGVAWEDADLEKRLRERLPKSYGLLLEIIRNINELMECLKKELGVKNPNFHAKIDKQGKLAKSKTSRTDLLSMSNFEFQAKRIRFSLKKKSREKLFAELGQANEQLRNLLDSGDRVAEARRTRRGSQQKSGVNRKISEFWQHATRLHRALSNAWQCGCTRHTANLQLQHRTSEQVEFDVVFNVASVTGNGGWRKTRIEMLSGGVTISSPQRAPARGARQVRWASQDNQVSPTSNVSNLRRIKCLCTTLSKPCPGCFGYLDEDQDRFVFYPKDLQIGSVTAPRIITLEELLRGPHIPLTRRNRYWLALTLASSYLQLCSTPWLTAPLRKDNILFLRDPSSNDSLQLEPPYIRGEMSKQSPSAEKDTMPTLGIRLLELCFGKCLENSEFRLKLPPGDAASAAILDYAAAVQWSNSVSDEAGPEFAEAIDWCLHFKELSDGSWRKEIWSHVIVPLDYCHRQVSQRLGPP